MVDTPKFPDNPVTVQPGTVAPRVAGHSTNDISHFKPEALLKAQVLTLDKEGNPILRTSVGDITVSSNLTLPKESNLILKVLVNGPHPPPRAIEPGKVLPFNFQARVVSIDGKATIPPNTTGAEKAVTDFNIVTALTLTPSKKQLEEIYAQKIQTQQGTTNSTTNTSTTSNATTSALTQTSTASATIVNISNGVTLNAVVISPSASANNFFPSFLDAPLRPSDGVRLHVLSITLPKDNIPSSAPSSEQSTLTKTSLPQPTTGQAGSSQEQSQLAVRSNPYRSSVPPSPVFPGQETTASPSSSQPVATSTTPQTSNPSFTGFVIGTEKSGEVVIRTPIGILKLPSNVTLPKGTELQLEILRHTQATPQTLTSSERPESINALLTAQREAIENLAAAVNGLGAEGKAQLQARVPAPDMYFFAKLLWFIAGVKRSDERLWLGNELTKMLEQQGKQDVLQQLRTVFSGLHRFAEGMPTSNWNALMFPVYDGFSLQHGVMFTRHYQEHEHEDEQEGTRFVVEVDLDAFGPMQFDGFVKKGGAKKTLNLLVRSKQALDTTVEQDIQEIFVETIEIMGINGYIQFQVVDGFPINPSEELGEANEQHDSILV